MNTATLTGRVQYMSRERLPEVTMIVELRDTSLMDTEARLIASTTRLVPAGGSLAYVLEYDPSALMHGRTYSVSARLYLAGRLHKINHSEHSVDLPGTETLNILVNFSSGPDACTGQQPPVEGIHGGNLIDRP